MDNFFTDCYTVFQGVSYMVKETRYRPAVRIWCNYEKKNEEIKVEADMHMERKTNRELDHHTGTGGLLEGGMVDQFAHILTVIVFFL